MTLAQLQSFVLVARLGSVKAAAAELGVTEPAVSVAVAALRKELGDELFVRDGRGIALTAGGRRLAALASEILGLAEQARRSVQDSPGQARLMQVAVTNVVAEHVGPLIDAFTARDPGLEVAIETVAGALDGRAARAPSRRHRAGAPAGARARGHDRHGAVPALPADRGRRPRAPAGRTPRHRRPRSWPASAGCWARPSSIPTTGAGLLFARAGIEPVRRRRLHLARGGGGRRGGRRRRGAHPGPHGRSRSCAVGRSRGSTCAAPRCSRCGTRRRSASGGRCPLRWRSSALPPAPRRPRRSRPAVPARPRRGPGRART